jgi:histidinol dehydrogenase
MVTPLPLPGTAAYQSLVNRSVSTADARSAAEAVIADVRRRGDLAVREWTERFDGARLDTSLVPQGDIEVASNRIDPPVREALIEAMRRIEIVHRAQQRTEPATDPIAGVRVWREWRPFQRVGLYVPGGRARYPSSVLMMAVPARIAGCPEIVLCSPPQGDGRVPDVVLAAAALAGVTEVHAVGGVQAIAAMAYGTERIPRVDKIYGPGNAYVTAAKLIVQGDVAIDMPAGPSELVIVTDGSVEAEWLAADLAAQAEHAPDALGIVLSTDERMAVAISRLLGDRWRRQVRAFTVPDLDAAIRFVNDFAPEHLALACGDAERWLPSISRVGSIFLGPYTPPAAGDYATGSNHVLPTGGSARSYGPLGVEAFGRMVQIQMVSRAAIEGVIRVSDPLAEVETLKEHRRSVEIRRGVP